MKKFIILFSLIFCLNSVSAETKYSNINEVITLFEQYKACSFMYNEKDNSIIYFFNNCNIIIIVKINENNLNKPAILFKK